MQTEPALIGGFVTAGVVLAIAFGAPITPEEKTAIEAFVGAGLALVSAFVTRSLVTPTANLRRRR